MGRHKPQTPGASLAATAQTPLHPAASLPPPPTHTGSSSQQATQILASAQPPGKMLLDSPQQGRWPFPEHSMALVLSTCLAFSFIQGRALQNNSSDPHLPARLAELLDVDGTAEGDDEQGEALSRQAVIADHGVQHLQRDLGGGRQGSCQPCPASCPQGDDPPASFPPPLVSDGRPSPLPKQPPLEQQE